MDLNLNLNSPAATEPGSATVASAPKSIRPVVACPSCGADIAMATTSDQLQTCPYCQKQCHVRIWPIVRQNNNAAVAMADQATCFFHPDKAFQACCQRCGRFVCGLCDLQLGAEHVCPTCFDRGRSDAGAKTGGAEWRYRDVLYDSIAVTVGWGWILFWPSIVAALPAAIFLHVKYRKAPRSYLVPRSGWRFWMAYVGLSWLPLLFGGAFLSSWLLRRH